MANFPTPVNRSPTYKVEVFNRSYSWEDASVNLDADADVYNSGWYEVPTSSPYVGLERLRIRNDIRKKSMCDFDVLDDELWMYACDMIVKRDSSTSSPFSGGEIVQQPNDSKLIIYLDGDGYSSPDYVGTIDIVGELDSSPVLETITTTQEGTYVSTGTYDTITSITMNDLSCHLSTFAVVGSTTTKREVRISCDTNNDGNFGIIFAGYMIPAAPKIDSETNLVTFRCEDYTSFFMSNEHIVGYRATHRCSHYSATGDVGDCDIKLAGTPVIGASARWHTVALGDFRCFVGDMDTKHPDGTEVDPTYRCFDYNEASEVLPYDDYTYDKAYEDTGDPKYSYYPEDYTRAMYALAKSARSIDNGVKSRDFDLHVKGRALAAEAIDISETGIDFDNLLGTIETNDFIRIDDEWMLVSSNITGTLTVTRGSLGSVAATHVDDSVINCYTFANTTYASNTHDFLIEADIGGTLYDTGESFSEILTSRISDSYFVFWIDFYKQLHMTEMYREDTGYLTNLTITTDDVTKVDKITVGEVVNQVSCWVKTSAGKFYRELTSDNVSGITASIGLFDLQSEEVRNDQLNIIGYDDLGNDKFGFLTFAEAFLKTHAYPTITQEVTVDTFVPDEHYWTNTYDPLLLYNDNINEYIDMLGTRLEAPDFSIEGYPSKTFVIEGIEYNITSNGNFDTKLTMSRISTESDYV